MAADVVMRVNGAFPVANDDHGVRIQFEGEVVARPGNFARVTGKQPIAPPDPLDVEIVNFAVAVKSAG